MKMIPDLNDVALEICRQHNLVFQRHLGEGAFKSAYLTLQGTSAIALKIAPVRGLADRLYREVSALRGCDHEGIAKVTDAFTFSYNGHQLWVVFEEFLAGGTLEERLDLQRILDSEYVRALGIALTDVLVHLRDRRLVHRDIKPANILFRDLSNTPVLTDFGVVRMLDQHSLTRDFVGMGPGTPRYAAPEQLNNEKAQIDWRTDQFGLAVVLAECALGRHPFSVHGQDPVEAVHAVALRRPLPLASADELKGLGLSGLVPALHPWPVSRYRHPSELLSALNSD